MSFYNVPLDNTPDPTHPFAASSGGDGGDESDADPEPEDDGDGDPDDAAPPRAIDARPSRAAATLAVLVAFGTVGGVLSLAGFGRAALAGTVAALAIAGGAWGLGTESRLRWAGGSVAATTGAVLLFGAFVLAGFDGGFGIVALGTLGLTVLTVDLTVGIDTDREATVSDAVRQSGNVVLVGIVLTAVGHGLLAYGVLPAAFFGTVQLASSTPLLGLLTLEAMALGVAFALPKAAAVLDDWVPDDGGSHAVVDSLDDLGLAVGDVPAAGWGVLFAQLLVVASPSAHRLFDQFFGALLGPVLRSGAFHAILLTALVLLLGVIAAGVVQTWIVGWFGDDPGETLALQAGGAVAVVAAVLLSGVLGVAGVRPYGGTLVGQSSVVGFPAIALGGLALVLVAVVVLLNAVTFVDEFGVLPARASGTGFGSALVFLAVLRSAAFDVPALALFAGVAGTLLVWDVGSHAASVGWQLGRAAPTRTAEFVHAGATTLVLGGGATLAALAYYVVVPRVAPAETQATAGAATLSFVLVLVAVLAFVVAAYLRDRPAG